MEPGRQRPEWTSMRTRGNLFYFLLFNFVVFTDSLDTWFWGDQSHKLLNYLYKMRRVKGILFSSFQNLTRSQRNSMISYFKYSCFRIVLSDHTHSSACGLRHKLKYHTRTNNLQRNCWDTSEWESNLIVKVAYIDNSFPSLPYHCCFAAKKAW